MDGLDAEYFRKNLQQLARDADNYTPDEMERALTRLADVAKGQKMSALEWFFRRPPVAGA